MTHEEIDVYVRSAMRRAFVLGVTYHDQIASHEAAEWYCKEADDTFRCYEDSATEAVAALSTLAVIK
jgi:hypothetical protein